MIEEAPRVVRSLLRGESATGPGPAVPHLSPLTSVAVGGHGELSAASSRIAVLATSLYRAGVVIVGASGQRIMITLGLSAG